uniref:Uncharacterized protein n=1 Tax=viral metagenome TaxID=1070528 RepID=A0A6C0D1V7_9ZZZZ
MDLELVNQKKYIAYLTAYKEDRLQNFYKGTFRGVHCILNNIIFNDVIEYKTYEETRLGYRPTALLRYNLIFFTKDVYTFHDIEQVKENKKKAIQSMEKRALDKILKRIVNEEFQWL